MSGSARPRQLGRRISRRFSPRIVTHTAPEGGRRCVKTKTPPGCRPEALPGQAIDGVNIAQPRDAAAVYGVVTSDLACRFHAAGLSVLRVKEDGSKEPDGKWKQYQTTPPTTAQLRAWFAGRRGGIGAVMGKVSGNLEMFEFDDWPAYLDLKARISEYGYGELIERIEQGYSEHTPRVAASTGTTAAKSSLEMQKLAQRPAPTADNARGVKTLIETRGEGGYSVMAPSGGNVHPSGRSYEVLSDRRDHSHRRHSGERCRRSAP